MRTGARTSRRSACSRTRWKNQTSPPPGMPQSSPSAPTTRPPQSPWTPSPPSPHPSPSREPWPKPTLVGAGSWRVAASCPATPAQPPVAAAAPLAASSAAPPNPQNLTPRTAAPTSCRRHPSSTRGQPPQLSTLSPSSPSLGCLPAPPPHPNSSPPRVAAPAPHLSSGPSRRLRPLPSAYCLWARPLAATAPTCQMKSCHPTLRGQPTMKPGRLLSSTTVGLSQAPPPLPALLAASSSTWMPSPRPRDSPWMPSLPTARPSPPIHPLDPLCRRGTWILGSGATSSRHRTYQPSMAWMPLLQHRTQRTPPSFRTWSNAPRALSPRCLQQRCSGASKKS
mmetsp:Transcript_21752/g.63295  ORF Transcript_21752/g.63295 Transcript_21752/m.63295 type:complete len:337 (+) Transcript_21752:480-1490(+)